MLKKSFVFVVVCFVTFTLFATILDSKCGAKNVKSSLAPLGMQTCVTKILQEGSTDACKNCGDSLDCVITKINNSTDFAKCEEVKSQLIQQLRNKLPEDYEESEQHNGGSLNPTNSKQQPDSIGNNDENAARIAQILIKLSQIEDRLTSMEPSEQDNTFLHVLLVISLLVQLGTLVFVVKKLSKSGGSGDVEKLLKENLIGKLSFVMPTDQQNGQPASPLEKKLSHISLNVRNLQTEMTELKSEIENLSGIEKNLSETIDNKLSSMEDTMKSYVSGLVKKAFDWIKRESNTGGNTATGNNANVVADEKQNIKYIHADMGSDNKFHRAPNPNSSYFTLIDDGDKIEFKLKRDYDWKDMPSSVMLHCFDTRRGNSEYANKVTIVEKGTAVLDGDGWVVSKKGVVDYE